MQKINISRDTKCTVHFTVHIVVFYQSFGNILLKSKRLSFSRKYRLEGCGFEFNPIKKSGIFKRY